MTLGERIDRARALLADIERLHAPAVFTTSFGAEDMVLLDLIAGDRRAIRTVTLDTGRLPPETLELMARAHERYGLEIEVFTPDAGAVAAYVARYGRDGFYDGIEPRKACCGVRKVEPLRRALAHQRAWVTGLRREQAASRADVAEGQLDAAHGLWKFSPLADWSDAHVWTYLRERGVPYNALHDRGYPSIGCEPCTRAVKPGEHPRAGRWWWEQDGARKECGLHEIPVKVLENA